MTAKPGGKNNGSGNIFFGTNGFCGFLAFHAPLVLAFL